MNITEERTDNRLHYPVFRKISIPHKLTNYWMKLLEGAQINMNFNAKALQ